MGVKIRKAKGWELSYGKYVIEAAGGMISDIGNSRFTMIRYWLWYKGVPGKIAFFRFRHFFKHR